MASTATGPSAHAGGMKITQPRVAVSEWVKLRSLRSAVWILAISPILTAGIGLLGCTSALLSLKSGHGMGRTNPAMLSLYGVYAGQLTYGVLGVLIVTREYATGMIRSTLTAVPGRLPVLWGKLAAVAVVTLVTAETAVIVSMLAGQAILSARHAGVSLFAPGVLRATVGAGLYLTVTGLLAVALGFLIRNTAGAIAVLFGIELVLPLVLGNPYLPSTAGQAVIQIGPATHTLPPWTGFTLFAGYTTLAVAAAAMALKRRDA